MRKFQQRRLLLGMAFRLLTRGGQVPPHVIETARQLFDLQRPADRDGRGEIALANPKGGGIQPGDGSQNPAFGKRQSNDQQRHRHCQKTDLDRLCPLHLTRGFGLVHPHGLVHLREDHG